MVARAVSAGPSLFRMDPYEELMRQLSMPPQGMPFQGQGQMPLGFGQQDSMALGAGLPPELKEFLERFLAEQGGLQADQAQNGQNPLGDFSAADLIQMLIDYLSNGMHQQNQGGSGGGQRSAGNMGGTPNWSGSPQRTSWPSSSGGTSSGGATRTGSPSSSGPSSSGPLPPPATGQGNIPGGLRANAQNGARVVRELGFDGVIGGIGQRSGPSDHPHGNAIDVMTNSDTAMGRKVAEHFRQNHEALGVKYVIYQQQIASPTNNWQWRPMEDRGSPTANHMDHPHISFH